MTVRRSFHALVFAAATIAAASLVACGSISKPLDGGASGGGGAKATDAGTSDADGSSGGSAGAGGAAGAPGRDAGTGTGGAVVDGGSGAGGANHIGGALGTGGNAGEGGVGGTGGTNVGGQSMGGQSGNGASGGAGGLANATGGSGTGGGATGGAGTGGSATGGAGTGGSATGGAGTGGASTVTAATWTTTAAAVQAQTGSTFGYSCPASGVAANVWGTDIYTADSSICTAAVHAGVLTLASGGTVLIQILPGYSAYAGSSRNGVSSANWTSFGYSYRFPAQTTWTTTPASFRGQNNLNLAYLCPANGTAANLWGTDIYTDDSSICTAAVHAGLVTLVAGGRVTISIVAGQASYTASARNGITSAAYGPWTGSFLFPK